MNPAKPDPNNPSDTAPLRVESLARISGISRGERWFRSLVQYSSDVVMILEADGTVRYVSPAVQRVLGYRPEDLVGTLALDCVHPEDVEYVSKAFAETLEKPGVHPPIEYRVRTLDGSWRHMEAIRSNWLDDPHVAGVVANIRDVTERRRAEEALKESEERYRSLVETVPAVTYTDRAIGSYPDIGIYTSPQIEALVGYSAEEWLDPERDLWEERLHPEDRSWVLAADERSKATGEPFAEEYRLIAKDGRVVWVRDEAALMRGERGEPLYWQGVLIDVTDRKKAEDALRESERRHATLLSNTPALVYRCFNEPGWPMEFASGYALELTGYPPEDLLVDGEVRLGNLILEEHREKVWVEVQEALTERRRFKLRYSICRKDGALRHVEEYGQGVYGEDGEVEAIEGLVYDVTEEVRAEERLRQAEHRYRTLVERVPAVVYVQEIGSPDSAVYMSPQIETLTGYSPEECKNPDLRWLMVHPDDRGRMEAEDERTGEPGEVFTTEYRVVHRDGRSVWVRNESVLVEDEASGSRYWQGFMLDITVRKQAEEALKESERRFRALTQNSSDVVTLLSTTGTILYQSPSIERILGYGSEETLGANAFGYVHPDDLERVEMAFAEGLKDPERRPSVEYRFRHKDGSWVWLESVGFNLLGDPEVGGYVANSRDVTERRLAEEELARQAALLEQTHDAVFRWELGGKIVYWNEGAQRIYGWSREDALGRVSHDLLGTVHPVPHEEIVRTLRRAGHWEGELVHHTRDGRRVVVESRQALARYDGASEFVLEANRDITERKALEGRLEHQAFHDSLTSLPNRTLFLDRLSRALERTRRRRGRKAAILFMDLDGFKVVNDSLGHEVGDLLLTVVAQRLRRCLRPEDTLARFGGDEFVVLLEEVESDADAVRVAERITEELRRPFSIEDRELFVASSIGIALGDARTKTPEYLLRDADTAMYRAKDEHADHRVFDPAMYERVLDRLELENDLRRAVGRDQLVVHYQPIVSLRTGVTWGLEALVRWNHPERGLLNPDEFVPIAEESGLVVAMGEWVLREACTRAKEWQEVSRTPHLVISVNLSARQLRRPDLIETVERVLLESGLDGSTLILDVTETVYMEVLEANAHALERLRDLGVKISIDDFGTGYSSLSYLKRLPAHAIKVDKSFVKGLGEGAEDTAIVRAVTELAHTLGREVIAEGVESWAQADLLAEMDCDLGQGFHFSNPLPPEEVPGFLMS